MRCDVWALGLPLNGLQFVAQGPVVAPLQPALLALALTRFDQVLQTTRTLHCRLPTFCASAVPLHTQLILPLPGDGQICELIFYAFSHFVPFYSANRLFSGTSS